VNRSIAAAAVVAALFLSGCSVLRNVHAEADRSALPDEELVPSGPERLVELLGEPDEWRNEKEGDHLFMTAVWDCVEGEHREVTWQSRLRDSGRQYWAVVSDVSEKCAEKR
jgi:hypothetical protein